MNYAEDSSEIFREYCNIQLTKQAMVEKAAEIDVDKVLSEFENFEEVIRSTPHLLATFRALQTKFATDLTYRKKVNPKFADSVMLLNLGDK